MNIFGQTDLFKTFNILSQWYLYLIELICQINMHDRVGLLNLLQLSVCVTKNTYVLLFATQIHLFGQLDLLATPSKTHRQQHR